MTLAGTNLRKRHLQARTPINGLTDAAGDETSALVTRTEENSDASNALEEVVDCMNERAWGEGRGQPEPAA